MMEVNVYQILMMIGLVFTAGISTGGLIYQVKRSASQEVRIDSMNTLHLARMDAMSHEISESRRENGVIIGCLYMLAATIGDPKIKEIIEGMLARERNK